MDISSQRQQEEEEDKEDEDEDEEERKPFSKGHCIRIYFLIQYIILPVINKSQSFADFKSLTNDQSKN